MPKGAQAGKIVNGRELFFVLCLGKCEPRHWFWSTHPKNHRVCPRGEELQKNGPGIKMVHDIRDRE